MRHNHYCAGCAQRELFGRKASGTEGDPEADLSAVDFDDTHSDRAAEPERER